MTRWSEGDMLRACAMLVDVVGREVALKKKGRDQWGLCTFHGEKTPSFKVDDGRC